MTILTRGLAFASLLSLSVGAAHAADVKIAMNGANDPETNAEAAFVQGFSQALEGTAFEVSVFPSGTLGKEQERFDQVAQGLLEVNLASAFATFGMSPLVKGIALPFLFEDNDEFDQVMAGTDLMDQMNVPLEENGITLAGFNFIGVGVGIHNKVRPVTKMEDLQGLRMRAMNAEQLAFEEAIGATGTIISWSEVANAIQTGVADGYLNPPNSAIRTGHTSFLTHFTPANIQPSARAVLVSADWYGTLSDEEKAQIDQALAAGLAANRDWVAAWEGKVRTKHEAAGVTISELEPGERDKLVEAAKTVWPESLGAEELKLFVDAVEQVRQ